MREEATQATTGNKQKNNALVANYKTQDSSAPIEREDPQPITSSIDIAILQIFKEKSSWNPQIPHVLTQIFHFNSPNKEGSNSHDTEGSVSCRFSIRTSNTFSHNLCLHQRVSTYNNISIIKLKIFKWFQGFGKFKR